MYLSKAEILPIYQLALTIAQKVFHLLKLGVQINGNLVQ